MHLPSMRILTEVTVLVDQCQMETTLCAGREARVTSGYLCGSTAPNARGAGWSSASSPMLLVE